MHLAVALREIDVEFDEKQNYIRCFAHVINLCAQAAIKAMEKDDADEAYSDSETEPATESSDSDAPQVAMRAIRVTKKSGPIRRARKTVAFIRKSGQRRDQFLEIIAQGNTDSKWTNAEEKNVTLAVVIVLPDVKTRWDSVFYMLRRLRYLRQVSQSASISEDAVA